MAEVRLVEPVVRVCAVITRHEPARLWALDRIADRWGTISIQSSPIPFQAGGYYDNEMGQDLLKVLVAVESVSDPAALADWKHETNSWERELAQADRYRQPRPINLDAGYVTQAKLVLATTKDRDHRIYLRDGMFAEVTLTYVGKKWHGHRWTYPSYRCDEVADFVHRCRNQLRSHLRTSHQFRRAES